MASEGVAADAIDKIFRDKLYQRFTHMTDAFRAVDKDNNGVLDVQDFAEVLLGLGFGRVTRSTIDLIAKKYDKNGDSLVTYAEFCATIEGKDIAPEAQRTVVTRADRVEEAFRMHVLAASNSMQQAFLKLDKDRSGHISANELEKVLRNAGVAVTPDEMKALVAKYDLSGDGKLDVPELAKLLEGCSKYPGHTGHQTKRSPAEPALKRART
ncbi:hypothetical protein T492DRAFT_997633 [Pavlovales sp. CCMP2436]|nr:hypothetical protein T492DRAFT_997633 [Pavlovales sp. CCMP2436]|mmetsp:Transcript_38414/g.88848  ORF Transcript_38414/g.88848 Transcript_38414/m.88848 type:complete len:211 (+) Transcript_38414:93-725(+)